MTSSSIPAARSQHLLDLLTQIPDPRKRRGRRHALAGLLGVGIAAVIAGSRSFAAIGQWAADAGVDVLATLGATRGAAQESTFRRAFAAIDAEKLDAVLGAWVWTRTVQGTGRLVIAIDGKTVRGARTKDGQAPHLVAALAHGIGAVLGQVAVAAKSNEIPAVRELLKAFKGPGRRRGHRGCDAHPRSTCSVFRPPSSHPWGGSVNRASMAGEPVDPPEQPWGFDRFTNLAGLDGSAGDGGGGDVAVVAHGFKVEVPVPVVAGFGDDEVLARLRGGRQLSAEGSAGLHLAGHR